MNDEGSRLLLTILDHPDEDTPRLVYADWLEENGDRERAEFIRMQIQNPSPEATWKMLVRNESTCANWIKWCWAEDRGKGFKPVDDYGLGFAAFPSPPSLANDQYPTNQVSVGTSCRIVSQRFVRGFVEEFHCTMRAWIKFCRDVVKSHPIRQVRITDKSPWESLEDEKIFGWWPEPINAFDFWSQSTRFEYCNIREDFLGFIAQNPKRFRTPVGCGFSESSGIVAFTSKEDAIEALSEACIQWAREQWDERSDSENHS